MSLSSLRAQIDQLDREIIERIARRLKFAEQTKKLKPAIRDEEREKKLRALWTLEAQKCGVDPQPCLAILQVLIDEAVRIQES